MTIPLGSYPGPRRAASDGPCSPCTGRGLASRRVAATLVGSYPTVSPLPPAAPEDRRWRCPFCSTFRRLSPPGLRQRPALRCPDFPRAAAEAAAPRSPGLHRSDSVSRRRPDRQCVFERALVASWLPHSGQKTLPPRACMTNSPQTRHSSEAPRSSATSSWSSVRCKAATSAHRLTAPGTPPRRGRGSGRAGRRSAPATRSRAAAGRGPSRGRTS